MRAINGQVFSQGYGANAVIQVGRKEPVRARGVERAGEEVILEAVRNPPRTGETRPIAALLPDVLARYGLSEASSEGSQRGAALNMTA